MSRKKINNISCALLAVNLAVWAAPVWAETYGPPAGFEGMTQAPSAEQIEQMIKEQQQKAMEGETPTMPDGFDSEKMSELAGGEAMEKAKAQIGGVFSQIQPMLLRAEDGIKELKEGQIKVDEAEESANEARKFYDEARAAFEAGKYQEAGQKLQEIKGLNLEGKFNQLESQAISSDLINDIRRQMKDGLDGLNKMSDDDDGEGDALKVKLMTSLDRLDEAEKMLKNGDKKGAANIMKQLRSENPDAAAGAATGRFKALGPKKLAKVLDRIKDGLERADRGFKKSEEMGIKVDVEAYALLELAKKNYAEARAAFDREDYDSCIAKLQEMKKMELEEKFTVFRDKIVPAERQKSIFEQFNNGVKALEITIQKAKDSDFETTELESLLVKLKEIQLKAKEALDKKDTETFLTLMDQADSLQVNQKVNEIIRKLANNKNQEIVTLGLEKLKNSVGGIKEAVDNLKKAKVDTVQAESLLKSVEKNLSEAQALFDAGDYIGTGHILDGAVGDIASLSSILSDCGVKIADEQMKKLKDAMSYARAGGMSNTSDAKSGKINEALAGLDNENMFLVKSSMMDLNPDVLDRISTQREKDKKFIDSIISEVMPLLPEKDRAATLEGKLGLLEEAKNAERTMENMKKIKGIKDNILNGVKEIRDKAKSYNFTPASAEIVDAKFADFNDKIQSGQISSASDIANYVKVLKGEIEQEIKKSVEDKYKNKVIPAKNIDDNNPLFDEIRKLKDDGALSADKNGQIDLKKKVDKKQLADMINKTIDSKALGAKNGQANVSDALKMAAEAYKIKTTANFGDFKQASEFAKKIGVELKSGDFKKPLDLAVAADIVAGADERWGVSR